MTSGRFLELLISSGYGSVAEAPPSHDQHHESARVSQSLPVRRGGSRNTRKLFNSGPLQELRRRSRGRDHEHISHTHSKSPRQGQMQGNGGWRAFCSSGCNLPRKRRKDSDGNETVPDKEGMFKSRQKCVTRNVFLRNKARRGRDRTCQELWRALRTPPV